MVSTLAIPLPNAFDPASLTAAVTIGFRIEDGALYVTMPWSDPWSWRLLLQTAAHSAFTYEQFLERQNRWLACGFFENQRAYWERTLAGIAEFAPGGQIEKHSFSIPRCEDTALLTAYFELLACYTGESDICIGILGPNRHRPGSAGVIGPLANVLGIRVDASAPDLRREVGRAVLDALRNQDLPQTRTFAAMFLPESVDGATWLTPRSHADLTLTSDGFEYNPARYERETIVRMAEHLQNLLRTGQMPGLVEMQQLELWNRTDRPYRAAPVHELIQASDAVAVSFEGRTLTYRELLARAASLAAHLQKLGAVRDCFIGVLLHRSEDLPVAIIAIWMAGGAYLPLEPSFPRERLQFMMHDANARILITQRELADVVAAEHVVTMENSFAPPETVGYAEHRSAGTLENPPLESPKYAEQRRAARLAGGLSPRFSFAPLRAKALIENSLAAGLSTPASEQSAHENDPACILYTSGSTGQPKGALISHRNLVNLFHAILDETGFVCSNVMLAISTITFDAAAMELFAPLLVGGRVEIASRDVARDSRGLRHLIEQSQPDMMFATPATWRALVESGWQGSSKLRSISGGEVLQPDLAAALLARSAAVWNGYGPTETTVFSTMFRVRESDPNGRIPIGRPIANTRLSVRDQRGTLLPPGFSGELCIAGDGVSSGYLDRPELTASKFTPDGQFRTGDLVRFLPNGTLAYLGRLDTKAKVRGNRVEAGEVEAALLAFPGIHEAAVLTNSDSITAYLVGDAPVAQLRSHVASRLPDFMIPSRFLYVEAMPLTPSGKIDLLALPLQPVLPEPSAQRPFLAPRTAVEKAVAAIFSEVLPVDRVAADDDFFHLGGHSLLAAQVLARVWEMWKIELPARVLFESPTVSELASRIGEVQTPKREVVAKARPAVLPLSFAQQRLWFLDNLYQADRALYNIPIVLRLSGHFDLALFERALNQVIARHESLRTNFTNASGEPLQIIAASRHITVQRMSRDEALAETGRPFDLARDPLIRVSIAQIGTTEHELVIVLHHIVSDGWSFGVLFRELNALMHGRTLPPLAMQYADFALQERETLTNAVLEHRVDYWRRQLAGAPALLELPADASRAALQTFRGARLPFALPKQLADTVNRFSAARRVTPFMVLLAAFQVLLRRYSGETDISIGTPIANRTRIETEGLIGFFANTLVLRTSAPAGTSFLELLASVRHTALEAFAHQDVPFQKLVESLQPDRALSHTPFFQVMFAVQNADSGMLDIPGVVTLESRWVSDFAKFDITFNVENTETALAGAIEYNRDLFQADRMERLVGHYATLLEHAIASPATPVDALAMLTPAEHETFAAWNRTDGEYPQASFPELFTAQAARTPDAIAVKCEGRRWTYEELDERSDAVAGHLHACGVKSEQTVALVVERSLEMMAGLLGIWKAGGAYIPIDPDYPDERQTFMREDSGATLVLTRDRIAALPPHSAPALNASRTSLAYVIYTSGSTGKPKGVALQHGSLMNLLEGMRRESGIGAHDAMLALATAAFDMSVPELWLPLTVGARVVIATRDDARDGTRLRTLVEDTGITIMQGTPTTWTMLLEAGWRPDRNFQLLCGAEALPEQIKNRLAELPCTSWNMFGPTETCVWSTMARIDHGPVTIGRPMLNTRVYVLDANRQPMPVGVPGELFIAGAGVARGYWNRPELTAEKFIDGPSGDRVYCTGDRVRWRADGRLEFVERLDRQVKLRGFRIELGEIEAALERHPSVSAAAVTLREDQPGDRRLIAYLVADSIDESELRGTLGRGLPDYMMPSLFVRLDALPLSLNGKVDRRALPPPDDLEALFHRAASPLASPIEEVIAGIFASVLCIESVGPDHNFFQLGGHSLLATRVVSQIREKLSMEVALRTLFEEPTVAGLARRLFDDRHGEPLPPLKRYPRGEQQPVSFAQQRLWFLDRFHEGETPMYNIAETITLTGALDIERLRQAISGVIAHHETLRTGFRQIDGIPFQVISPDVNVTLEPEELQETELHARVAGESGRPFDLTGSTLEDLPFEGLTYAEQRSAGSLRCRSFPRNSEARAVFIATGERSAHGNSLIRVNLYRLSPHRHVLLIVMHHAISDMWSFGVFHRELRDRYAGLSIAALAYQYSDFAQWQRDWLSGERLDRELAYWTGQLSGAPPFLDLPLDRPRPAKQTFRAGNHAFALTAEQTASLKRYSRNEGATLFMTLLAALQTLLARYTGTTDICVGTPIANRTRVETEAMIGFFANTLVMRTSLAGDPAFHDVLRRVRETALQAYTHQDLPFEKLVEALEPERSASHTPLFQVLLILHNLPEEHFTLDNLDAVCTVVEPTTARFDITLAIEERDGTLACYFNYNRDLFDASRMERMAGHFATLLEAAIATPERHIASLPLLASWEQQELASWNETRGQFPPEAYPALFAAQLSRTPGHIAVEYEGRTWTYAELDERANAVAGLLRAHGAGPETLVGIVVERSLEMMAGMLGIWKAGGAYLPIDPDYPEERQAFMRQDSGVALVLSKSDIAALPAHEPFPCPAGAQNLAYVIYTSGSTGKPKGVAIEHRSLINLLEGMRRQTGIAEHDNMLALATAAFDMSVPELWLPLINGARVTIAGRDDARDGARLRTLMEQSGATIAQGTPTTWTLLLDRGWRPCANFQLLCGAEALPESVKDRLAALPCTSWNMFGPTETCVWSTMARIHPGPVSIGRPMLNTRVYVLDAGGEPAPVGIAGELYIAGEGVARGYWNRPELTAEKFLVLPSGDRVYRTGDRVRWRADGRLEFVERMDSQVKLRGFRIELGEIESVLAGCTGVRAVAVAIREDEPGDKRLIAYLVGAFEEAELRRTLALELPDYMTPSRFIMLEALPRTANGKIDRRALPAPPLSTALENDAPLTPRTATEEILAAIFCNVLGLVHIGLDDNFFHFGGHSLLATRVLSQVREKLRTEVALRTLFESPTVRGLARRLQENRSRDSGPPVRTYPRTGHEPASYAQQRLWFLDRYHEGASPMNNIPETLALTGHLDVNRLRGALARIVARHESLRTTFHQHDGFPVQVIAANADLDFTIEQIGEAALQERIAAETDRAFDLARGPLMRIRLYRLAPHRHVLLIVMHHVISDVWSFGVLHRELRDRYIDREVPGLPFQYADFAQWQREWLTGDRLASEVEYWKTQLAGAPAFLELPSDRARPVKQTFRAGNHAFRLSPKLTQSVKLFSLKEGATLFMTLLATLQALLARYTGVKDICVGTPVANRTRIETEEMIGFFANTLVLRSSLAGEPSFHELLDRVRETTLGAYAHQHLPFEKLVEVLEPERSPGHTPLFQVFLILQNLPEQRFSLEGITVEATPGQMSTARFDLTLVIEERDGFLDCFFNYNHDLFDANRMERMAGHFVTLLEAAIADPEKSVSLLPLLTDWEHRELGAWNDTGFEYPQAAFPELFAAQASLAPHTVAVEGDGDALTYRELDERSNAVALHLRNHGVAPESLVGIVVERSVEMVVGLLGIWKAGAAYVPIDPDYPEERQAFIRQDSGVALVLTRSAIAKLGASDARVESGLTLDHAAYVMYTSGSTGKPKGVVITHRSVSNLLASMRRDLRIASHDIMLAVTTAAFDISVLELWLPLLVGARLIVATREESRDGSRLRQLLISSHATMMQATPTTWTMLLDSGWQPAPGFQILCGAEALPERLWRRIAALDRVAWNLFGPTETTVWSTMAQIDSQSVNIGRPIANTRVYVLDESGQTVPVGIAGELYIAGDGLAREYLNRPELTAERFLIGPAGGRVYRTGDRVRWNAAGKLEFFERLDRQVKLRGFRIELGEIEAALSRHPGVQNVAVLVREEEKHGKELVAYLVLLANSQAVTEDALRQALAPQLPAHMIPSRFVVLDALPLTANGKVDRRELSLFQYTHELARSEPAAHGDDELELALVAVWQSVFRRKSISVTDNFFSLGGHSLQAARLVNEMEAATKLKIPLAALFSAPTVRQLAAYLRTRTPSNFYTGLAGLQPLGSQPPVFMAEARGLFYRFAQLLGPDQPLFGMPFPDLPELEKPHNIPHIASLLVERIRALQPHGPYVLGGWCIATTVVYEMAQQLTGQGETVAMLLFFDGINVSRDDTRSALSRWKETAQVYTSSVADNLQRIRGMGVQEGATFATARAVTLLKQIRILAWRAASKILQLRGGALGQPGNLRDIERAVMLAAFDYKPKPYAGRVVYFKRGVLPKLTGDAATFWWGPLLARGLEIYDTGGRHSEMFQAPNVEPMAAKVRELLAEVHREHPADPTGAVEEHARAGAS